jgi:hypothetical protein
VIYKDGGGSENGQQYAYEEADRNCQRDVDDRPNVILVTVAGCEKTLKRP